MSLHACPSCARHVRRTEPTCPFCAVALAPAAHAPVGASPSEPDGRPTRASLAFGTTLGVVAVSTVLFGTACPLYGGPADRPDAPPSDAPAAPDAPAEDAP